LLSRPSSTKWRADPPFPQSQCPVAVTRS
jgi:hypothetical protein